jgi:hypothetical protein
MLESLAGVGTLSDAGVFTIDVRAALPKLEKFQLPAPHFGLLKVVQSAVGSGATYVNTHFSTAGINIEHDGRPPEPDELRDLLTYLLNTESSSADRSLRDLAIGVNTALARGASWVEVSTRTPEGWVAQRWLSREESSVQQPRWERNSGANVRFVLRRTLSQSASEVLRWANKDIGGLLARSRDVMDEDARAVHDRCRHAPIKVNINGRSVPPSTMGHPVMKRWGPTKMVQHRKPNLVEICLQASAESPHLISAPTHSHARHRFVMNGQFDGNAFVSDHRLQPMPGEGLAPRRCFAVIGIRGAKVPGELIVIKDGVDLTRLTPPVLAKGTSVLMTAEGLRLDISQFRIVDSPETKARLSWVAQTLGHCASWVLLSTNVALSNEEQRLLELVAEAGGAEGPFTPGSK